MWFRYLAFSFLNIVLELFGLVLFLAYVVPDSIPAWGYRLIGWVISFIFAVVFAYWAFAKKIPEKKDAILLVAFHVTMFLFVYSAYGMLFSDHGAGVIFTVDFMVQLGLEVLAIMLVSYRLRRSKLQSMLGEGRVL
ncbi:MAG: hypothetical protein ABIO72_02265 [Patescibacteria group bacterium]